MNMEYVVVRHVMDMSRHLRALIRLCPSCRLRFTPNRFNYCPVVAKVSCSCHCFRVLNIMLNCTPSRSDESRVHIFITFGIILSVLFDTVNGLCNIQVMINVSCMCSIPWQFKLFTKSIPCCRTELSFISEKECPNTTTRLFENTTNFPHICSRVVFAASTIISPTPRCYSRIVSRRRYSHNIMHILIHSTFFPIVPRAENMHDNASASLSRKHSKSRPTHAEQSYAECNDGVQNSAIRRWHNSGHKDTFMWIMHRI